MKESGKKAGYITLNKIRRIEIIYDKWLVPLET